MSHLLYNHFIKKRYTVELYKRYAAFIKPLGIFLAIISHSLVALHLEEISGVNEPLCKLENFYSAYDLPWSFLGVCDRLSAQGLVHRTASHSKEKKKKIFLKFNKKYFTVVWLWLMEHIAYYAF